MSAVPVHPMSDDISKTSSVHSPSVQFGSEIVALTIGVITDETESEFSKYNVPSQFRAGAELMFMARILTLTCVCVEPSTSIPVEARLLVPLNRYRTSATPSRSSLSALLLTKLKVSVFAPHS